MNANYPRHLAIQLAPFTLLLLAACGESNDPASDATNRSAAGANGAPTASGELMGGNGTGEGNLNSGTAGSDPAETGTPPPGTQEPIPSNVDEPMDDPDAILAQGGASGMNTDSSVGQGGGDDMMPDEMTTDETMPDEAEPMDPQPTESESDVPISESNGCSADATAPDGPQTIDVDGTQRSYIVSLPDDYDPTTPHPLIFGFHGLGGSAEGSGYFGFGRTGGTPSIYVFPDGLDTGMGKGWSNTDGQDVAFFDAMLASMEANYCVDSARVFSTGHSFGGMMSHTLACQRANVLRAVAPVAGAMFFSGGDCSGPVAALGVHGNPDNTVDYESGLSAIQRIMETNGCDPESGTPVEPTEFCTHYECDAGYPVTWCVHGEDHNWPRFAGQAIKDFFDSF